MNTLRRCRELVRRFIRALAPGVSLCSLATIVNSVLLSNAAAYIDPGTGTMMIQVLGALIASALFYLRGIRVWLADKLGLSRTANADHAPEQSELDDTQSKCD